VFSPHKRKESQHQEKNAESAIVRESTVPPLCARKNHTSKRKPAYFRFEDTPGKMAGEKKGGMAEASAFSARKGKGRKRFSAGEGGKLLVRVGARSGRPAIGKRGAGNPHPPPFLSTDLKREEGEKMGSQAKECPILSRRAPQRGEAPAPALSRRRGKKTRRRRAFTRRAVAGWKITSWSLQKKKRKKKKEKLDPGSGRALFLS